MSTAHLILQGKGGVGKSFAAFLLAQYLPEKSVLVRCFDADPINNTLASFPAANLVCQQQISMLGLPAQFDRIFRVMHNWLKRHRLAVLAPFAAHRRFDQP